MNNYEASTEIVLGEDSHDVYIMNPVERMKRYGLECVGPLGDGITFNAGTWNVGGEYTQKLKIRNVSNTVRKFKYRLPKTRFFSMSYPEVTTLSPGIEIVVDVVFRPIESEPYDDSIFIKMMEGEGSGGFHVPVRAFVSKLSASIPFGVDLGYAATEQTTYSDFELRNSGEKELAFNWDVPSPFTLEPMSGIIPQGESVTIRASIMPSDASVFVSQAICYIEQGPNIDTYCEIEEPMLITRLSAIGKYTHIELSDERVDYGEVLAGTSSYSLKKQVLLRNRGVVPAEFKCTRQEKDNDDLFVISPSQGIIPALSEITVEVMYQPLANGVFQSDHFLFETPGGSTTILTCSGQCMPAIVTLRKENLDVPGSLEFSTGSPGNSLNFRDIEVDHGGTRVLFLKNNSTNPTYYSIDCSIDSVFHISPTVGVIPPLLEVSITVVFHPTRPQNYYRRFFILVADAMPLYFDCMGTGYISAKGEIKEQRPAPLRHAHVQAYRNRNNKGIGGMNPDELDDLYASRGHEDEFKLLFALAGRNGTRPLSVPIISNPLTRSGDSPRLLAAVGHELFIDDDDESCRDVTLSVSELSFGYVRHHSYSEAKAVTVTNKTNGKVSVQWNPVDDDRAVSQGRALPKEFAVEPSFFDLSAGQSKTFKVTFRPLQSDRNYVNELECFVYFKNQRTFRLVEDTSLTPPWCLPLKVFGNTFSSGQLLSKAIFSGNAVMAGKLTMPHTYLGDSVFHTLLLKNTSNLPCSFRFTFGFDRGIIQLGEPGANGSTEDDSFTIKPRMGEIDADSFVLVCVKFTPKQCKKYTHMLRCIANEGVGGSILLEGRGSLPNLRINDLVEPNDIISGAAPQVIDLSTSEMVSGFNGAFYLRPTSVGLSSKRDVTIKNTSRLPVKYKFLLPANAHNIMSISPSSGVLKGNTDTTVTVAFAPQQAIKYDFKVKCIAIPVAGRPSRIVDAAQAGQVALPDPMHSILFNIIGPADIGAMLFDPPRELFDVRLVGTSDMKHVCLENVSDSDVSYNLLYNFEFIGDPGTNKHVKSRLVNLTNGKQKSPTDAKTLRAMGGLDHPLYCSEPSGILAARSRLTLSFTFHPTGAGLFEFNIIGRLIVTMNGEPVEVSNEEASLLRVSQQDREGNSVYIGNEEDMKEMPLQMSITGRATFPTLVFNDIRTKGDMLISNVENLWKQFSLSEINKDLSLSLTETEAAMNDDSSPNFDVLNRYKFEFTPDVLGAPLQEVTLSIKNIGHLPTSFHMHFPNEKELELEPWCDDDEPTEERLRQISIIEELKCLSISPTHGHLEPGQTIELSLSYHHSHLKYQGIHELPILVKIEQGKMFWIDLCGRTLPPESIVPDPTRVSDNLLEMLIRPCSYHNQEYHLKSQPYGLKTTEAPKQRFELSNVSSVDAYFEIDMEQLRILQEDNFGVEIFRIPVTRGLVHKRSNLKLDIYFTPVEAKEYRVEIPIKYASSAYHMTRREQEVGTRARSRRGNTKFQNTSLILVAKGYDPRITKPAVPTSLYPSGVPPAIPVINLEDQIAQLSFDYLDFSLFPQYGKSYRYTILRNLSSHPLDFKVDSSSCYMVPAYDDDGELLNSERKNEGFGIVSITPREGIVDINSHVVLDICCDGETNPISFLESIQIICREIIQKKKKKQKSQMDLMKDQIAESHHHTKGHESVVKRNTFSRSVHMEHANIPEGKTSKLPTTVDENGKVIGGDDKILTQGGRQASFAIDGDEGINIGTATITGHDASGLSGGQPSHSLSRGMTATSRTSTQGHMTANTASGASTAGSRGGTLSRGGSHVSSRGGNHEPPTLLGPPTIINLRVEGEIHSENVITSLLGKGPAQIPKQVEEICYGREVDQRSAGTPDVVLDSFVRPIVKPFIRPVPEPDPNFLVGLSVGESSEGNLLSGGDHGKSSSAMKPSMDSVRRTMNSHRAGELRKTTEDVIGSLMVDLLKGNDEMISFASSILCECDTLQWEGQDGISKGDGTVRGRPIYGLMFGELVSDQPLEVRLAYMLKALDVVDESQFITVTEASTGVHSLTADGITHTLPHSSWIDGPSVHRVITSSVCVNVDAFVDCLVNLGAQRKGNLANNLRSLISEDGLFYQKESVLLSAIVAELSPTDYDKINRIVTLFEASKRKIEREQKKKNHHGLDHNGLDDENGNDKLAVKNDEEDVTDEPAVEATPEIELLPFTAIDAVDDGVGVELEASTSSMDTDEREDRREAIDLLQRAMRGSVGRARADEKRLKLVEEKAKLGLIQPGVLNMASDVLRNTIFNLIQEATFEEFNFAAEPLKFAEKQ